MKFNNFSIVAAIFLAGIACTNTDTSDSPSDLLMADIAAAKGKEKEVYLSDFASTVSYIGLQTESVPLIDHIREIKTDGNILAVVNFSNDNKNRNVLLFDMSGNYIRQIGAHGRGPGEYYLPYGVELFPADSTIIVADNTGWLYKYTYGGDFIDKKRVDPFSSPVIKQSDSTFFLLKCQEYSQNAHHKALLFNTNLDSLNIFIDRSRVLGKRSLLMVYDRTYKVGGNIHIWDNVSDTTWFFDGNQFNPAYILKYTESGLSFNDRFSGKRLKFMEYENALSNVSTRDNIFIVIMHNMERFNYIFDKKDGSGFRITDSQEFLFSGLPNDLDGGMSFWPEHQLRENYFYEIIYPSQVLSRKDEFIQNAHENNLPQDTPFFKLLDKLKENDNPVIMLVEFK